MRTITKLVAIASLAVSLFGSAFATNWQCVGISLENNQISAYDIDNVRRKGTSTFAWVVYVNTNPKTQHDMLMALNEIDCEALRVKRRMARWYLMGKVIKRVNSTDYESQIWRDVPPGTMVEITTRSICKREQSKVNFEGTLPSEITKWGKAVISAYREVADKRF